MHASQSTFPTCLKTGTAALLLCCASLLAAPLSHAMAPPLNEEFLENNLPDDVNWLYDSSTEGRIELKGDDSALTVNPVPQTIGTPSGSTGGTRTRGNYFRCDTTVGLYRQAIHLGRSQSTSVQFLIYESTTENGTYSLISSNTVTASIGTNMLYSGVMDTTMRAGYFYLLAASWDQSSAYQWYGAHPVETDFGESLNGYEHNVNPAPTSTSGYKNALVYHQELELATNMVMRMDDSVDAGLYATNKVGILLELAGYTDVTLSFRHRESGDEAHPDDGIFLSVDGGSTYANIFNLDPASTTWTTENLDLNTLAAANGLTLSDSTVIQFRQVDNYGWPTDGREFDDIRIYAKPDLYVSSATTTLPTTNLLKGFSSDFILPISVTTIGRSGNTTENYPNLRFRYALNQSGSPIQSATETRSWTFEALETTNRSWSSAVTVPAGTPLPGNLYTLTAEADLDDAVDEALEDNNTGGVQLVVNHYSGTLWFDNLATDITIADWTRTSDTEHYITGSGTLDGNPFTFTDLRVEKDPATLDYTIHPNETQIISVPVPDQQEQANVRYRLPDGVTLSRNGGYADVEVRLPAGLMYSYSSGYVMASKITFSSQKLVQGLYPDSPATRTGPFYISEETKPLNYEVQDITWTASTGRFDFTGNDAVFTRAADLDSLEIAAANGDLEDPAMAEKRSNAQYYRFFDQLTTDIIVTTASDKSARLSTTLQLTGGTFSPHFPAGPILQWSDVSTIELQEDLIAASSTLINPGNLQLSYATTCATNPCASTSGPATVALSATSDILFSKDGGFRLPVVMSSLDLQWGQSSSGDYAQEALGFNAGTFYMPGHFIRGDQSQLPVSMNLSPGVILYSGDLPKIEDMERPGHYSGAEDYRNGFADYAGLNLRNPSDGAHVARCTLGGIRTDTWPLSDRSKYYVRPSGVSGIHEAVYKAFPETLEIYGYVHDFSNYGLSFLSGEPEESRINGLVSLPYPSNFDIAYEEMNLDCLGQILDADISGAPNKLLAYWNAVIDPATLYYAPMEGDSCSEAKRALCLGITTACANIDDPLAGVLGFLPSGEIAAKNDGVEGVDSRLSLPNGIQLDGPSDETYGFAPILSAYYNDYGESGDGFGDTGWINVAGALDVAFFDDLDVLFHTSASTNSLTAPIHMTGGFSDSSGHTFRSHAEAFDDRNAGFPNSISVENFRNPDADTYRTRAQKTWLEIVDFDYPLEWSSASKSFKSPSPIQNDLLVLEVEHQTEYLSAEHAELAFGVQYDGLPQINLANMAFNAVDESTGMAQAFVDGVGEEIFGTVEDGMDRFDNLLSDVPEKLFDPVLDETVDPVVDTLYTELYNAYQANPDTDYYSGLISNYVAGAGVANSARDALDHLVDGVGTSTNLLGDIDRNLERVLRTIDAFVGTVEVDPITGEQLAQPIDGLLQLDGTRFEQLGDLASSILGSLAAELVNSLADELRPQLDAALDQVRPALDTATEYLVEVRGIVTNAQEKLTLAGSFGTELQNALDPAELQAAVDAAAADLIAHFDELRADGDLFTEYTPEEIKQQIRQAIDDRFYGSLACADIQQIMRSRLYDLQASLNTAIDGVFQQVNQAMRSIISEYLTVIDEEINGMLGDLSDIVGAGQIDGYAHIRNDSLTELRLDGAFQWKVPDEMEFGAYLIIKQLNSDGSASCGAPGGDATEVTLGSDDVGLDWTGTELRAKINTKFAFATEPFSVIGLAGAFEMTEGEIGFESFAMTELYAAVAFGQLENYLSAAVRCELTSFEVEGGVFFGRTCSLDPFAWDPDVQGILGDPPFTGVYVYGEGWMPIIDYGCLFRIKAGVGAGMFAFVDGPVGGKMFLGAEGEAICVVGVRGEVTLVGMKNGDVMRLKGKGKISGKVGACPFCVKFSKSAEVIYENGSWDADY